MQIICCKYGLLRFHGSKYQVRLNGSKYLVPGSKSFTLALRALPLGVQHQTSSNIVIEVNISHRRKKASLRTEKYPIVLLGNVNIAQRYSGLAGSRSEEAADPASAPSVHLSRPPHAPREGDYNDTIQIHLL